MFRNRDPLHGVSGRQVLEILREYHDLQAPPEGADLLGTPSDSVPGSIRISLLVAHQDGSRTVVVVEMDR